METLIHSPLLSSPIARKYAKSGNKTVTKSWRRVGTPVPNVLAPWTRSCLRSAHIHLLAEGNGYSVVGPTDLNCDELPLHNEREFPTLRLTAAIFGALLSTWDGDSNLCFDGLVDRNCHSNRLNGNRDRVSLIKS